MQPLTTEDIEVIRRVVTDLARQDWFDRSPANLRACVELVLSDYLRGIDNPDGLLHSVAEEARVMFSRRN